MGNLRSHLSFIIVIIIVVLSVVLQIARIDTAELLSPPESQVLLRVQSLLQYQHPLRSWTNSTDFCHLPPSPSLHVACSSNHITRLTIVGGGGGGGRGGILLTKEFSIDSLFAALASLPNLTSLSLVSLGIWGPFPAATIHRFSAQLRALNVTSNRIYGQIPASVADYLRGLTTLVLADNLFNGSIPDLRSMAALQELDLSGNRLAGGFPALGDSLVVVVLRNNSIRSRIPEEQLLGLHRLARFDVSWNRFVGPLPASLFSLPAIRYLNLAGNQLTGALPASTSCSDGLEFVDISSNLLMGDLPACIFRTRGGSNRTVDYSWNCLSGGSSRFQHPGSFCERQALAVKPSTEAQVQQQESTTANAKLGTVFGALGGCIGFGVLGLFVSAFLKPGRAKKAAKKPKFEARHVPRTMMTGTLGLPPYQILTLEDIEDATNNLDPSNLMGEGSYSHGQLYKGWLRDGSQVLVICLEVNDRRSHLELGPYAEMISKLRHQNLVSVLGHCVVTHEDPPGSSVFIVFEHVSSRSLMDQLKDCKKNEMLSWPQRLSITMGIARGIQFLHTGIAPGIFGNNLRTKTILLDDHFTPKISGYNIPLPSTVAQNRSSSEEAVPNALGSILNSEKNDIYLLGKIIVELVIGRPIATEAELYVLRKQVFVHI